MAFSGKKNQPMQQLLIKAIRFYQKYISSMKGTKCPYVPSCSEYGMEAIRVHGAAKGSLLAAWRILRCNPFSHGGYDPVPEKHVKMRAGNSF